MPREGTDRGYLDAMAGEIEGFLGEGIRVEVEAVTSVAAEPSGKRMVFEYEIR